LNSQGKVELNGQIIVADTFIWLNKNNSNNWSGHFSVAADLSTEKWIEIHNNKRKSCKLILEDGRSGELIINPEFTPPKIHFLVTGDLAL